MNWEEQWVRLRALGAAAMKGYGSSDEGVWFGAVSMTEEEQWVWFEAEVTSAMAVGMVWASKGSDAVV